MSRYCASGLIGALLCVLPSAAQTPKKQPSMSEDMRQAIAFERAKDRAAERQARIEARQSEANRSAAERKTDKPKK